MATPSPILSFILICAVFAAALTTGVMGVQYWIERDDFVMVVVVVIAESVSAFGLSVSIRMRSVAQGKAICGLVIVIAAVVVCGATTWSKLDADARERADAEMRALPLFVDTQAELANVILALRDEFNARPPDCTCPATIAVWSETQRARIDMLAEQRADAEGRLIGLQPAVTISAWDIIRAVFLELVKLFGIFAFGAPSSRPEPGTLWRRKRRAGALGALGVLNGTVLFDAVGAQASTSTAEHYEAHEPSARVRTGDPAAIREMLRAQARAMALEKVPKTQIARRLGVHRNTVHNWLRLA